MSLASIETVVVLEEARISASKARHVVVAVPISLLMLSLLLPHVIALQLMLLMLLMVLELIFWKHVGLDNRKKLLIKELVFGAMLLSW